MKTSKRHQLLSILMTLLVTMSSVSMTIRSHYCGDDLIEISVFSDTEACISDKACSMILESENFDCCYDIIDVVESHEFVKTNDIDEFNTVQKHLFLLYLNNGFNLFEILQKKTIHNLYYESPPLIFDIHSLDEVYLI